MPALRCAICCVLAAMSAGSPDDGRPTPPGSALPATRPDRRPPVTGIVPAEAHRPIAPTQDEELARLLKRFEDKAEPFAWTMQEVGRGGGFTRYDVQFPSPYVSPVEVNNTVHGEYYQADGRGRAPGVIVLHILDGSFTVARTFCCRLAGGGVHALLMKMPYYGPRRPADRKGLERQLREDPRLLADAVTQAVMDIRRSASWLACRSEVDPARVGVSGVSLGGFAAALAGGVDGRFPRVAVLLAGGDLPQMIYGATSREVGPLYQEILRRNWTKEYVAELLRPIDPLTYAARLKGAKVLMINGSDDPIVPPACARALAQAAGAEITWYKANHYTMALYMIPAAEKLLLHFAAEKW